METRRTHPGFLSEGEAETEKRRTEEMVRNIVNYKEKTKTNENSTFIADRRFWSSWQGRIIRAIVLSGAYARDTILKVTKLSEEEFEHAHMDLLQHNLLEERENGKFWANRDLYRQCLRFYTEQQEALVDWTREWMIQEKVAMNSDPKDSHFYLINRHLSEFSESLIKQAKQSILLTNPYFKRCNISNSVMLISAKGTDVRLLTRDTETEQFKRELFATGVDITYDESIHAKLIVADRCVGIASSMNFYAGSSGGACWEAGIVTLERDVVNSIYQSILTKISDSKA